MTNSNTLHSPAACDPRIVEVLAVGPWDRGEFAVLGTVLGIGDEDWVRALNCDDAAELLSDDKIIPEWIFIAQPRQGCYEQHEIEELRRSAPLAQIMVVAGTWCEGELRTGKPLSGVQRLYWYEFASWWKSLQLGRSSRSFFLDSLLAPHTTANRFVPPSAAAIGIYTRTHASYEAISAALASDGVECMWLRDFANAPADITAAIWDGAQVDSEEFSRMEIFAAAILTLHCRLVVLLDFPRKEHFAQLQAIGCSTILGKPYVIDELKAACGLAT